MKISVYQLTKCGFYSSNGRKFIKGAISDWYLDFIDWTKTGKKIEDTAMQAPEDSGVLQNYCVSATELHDGFGIVLWNEVPNNKGEVSYIDGRSTVGNPQSQTAGAGVGQIPGWPSYFWILPDEKLIMCLRTKSQTYTNSTGLPQLRWYLQSYLLSKSKYIRSTENGNELESGEKVSFQTKPVKSKRALERIRNACDHIRKMHIRLSAIIGNGADSNFVRFYRSLGDIFGFTVSLPEADKYLTKISTPWTPTTKELNQAIEEWEDPNSIIHKIGVELDSDNKIYWFEDFIPTREYTLPESLELAPCWNEEQLISVAKRVHSTIQELIHEVHS